MARQAWLGSFGRGMAPFGMARQARLGVDRPVGAWSGRRGK